MKLTIPNIKVFFILTILIGSNLCTSLKTALMKTPSKAEGPNANVESVKFLFMYKYPDVKSEPNHKLNQFTYKNVLFANEQVIYFASPNDNIENKDQVFETGKYLITMRYEFLETPCLDKSFICTHAQFAKEYRSIYPEINYDVPKEVESKFGDVAKASENCLLLFLSSVSTVEDAAWLCHADMKLVLKTQLKLSKIVSDANVKDYSFVANYIQTKNTIIPGVMTLNKDKFTFEDFDKKEIIAADWKDIEPYANSLYLKENLPWAGEEAEKPDGQRCVKLQRTAELVNNNPDFFCAYYQKNDITQKWKLTDPEGRFAAEMYADKINQRLQNSKMKAALQDLSKMDPNSISIDDKVLFPIKMAVRKDYLMQRHELVVGVKLGDGKKDDLPTKLNEAKGKIIDKVCGGIDICKKAIGFCTDKELLPLKGIREKFALDMQNPFNSLMPPFNIKIDAPKEGSVGKQIMGAIAKLKGSLNYFAEPVPESPEGATPNHIAIKKAFNTFDTLKEKKEYKKFEELAGGCKAAEKNSSNDIRRKISLLMYAGDNDIFFEYLGYIRDFQLTKK